MSDEKTQRAMMAADLCERAAVALREGRDADAAEITERVTRIMSGISNPASHYGNGLFFARGKKADADLAIASIQRGEHPVDSLAGRVSKYEDDAETAGVDAAGLADPDYETGRAQGKCDAAGWMLGLLGVSRPFTT